MTTGTSAGTTAGVSGPRFHSLRVAAVEECGLDAVAISLEVPAPLRSAYAFVPGQHVTLRADVDGVDLRRSYSLCATPSWTARTGRLRVGVKRLPGGAFSGWVCRLQPGRSVDVLTPLGGFGGGGAVAPGHVVGIAAGSGITPVLCLLAAALEQGCRATLLLGNRSTEAVMLLEDLQDLKDRHPARFQLVHVLSRERQDADLLAGRIDAERLPRLLASFVGGPDVIRAAVQAWYLCGPYPMVTGAQAVLAGAGVAAERVHTELFFVEESPPPPPPVVTGTGADGAVEVVVTLDGRSTTLLADPRVDTILAAIRRARPDVPFSCTGGMCGTCRVRVVEGRVRMDRNFALTPEDLARGVALACQSRPSTPRVVLSYDT